jgi:arylsulfatase A-like enzyme
MRTIFILLDSLNRHMLPAYGNDWVHTPALDRLAERSVVFQNHFCGSMPCIPARRDLLTGKACFLEAPWGPIEPWDTLLTNQLRSEKGTYSHLITDHPHYFNGGAGDRYHNCFDSWEYERGQVWDPWHGVVDVREPEPGARVYGYAAYKHQHFANLMFRDPENEEHYPSVRCVQRAMEFVELNKDFDNWHLHLELFDPHEPYDCPKRYLDHYGDTWTGPPYTNPGYRVVDPTEDDDESIQHVRKAYAGNLTMVDSWLGRLFDIMDASDMWRDTAVILTTDHGLLVGEHELFGKNFPFVYPELCRLPLFVHHPDIPAGTSTHLTGAVDIMPTLLDFHTTTIPENLHGRSLVPILADSEPIHDSGLLYGYFGSNINVTDGTCTYTRYPVPDSVTHHHFSSITIKDQSSFPADTTEEVKSAEHGRFLRYCRDVPHYRSAVPWNRKADHDFNPVIDLRRDPGGLHPIQDQQLESTYARLLADTLESYRAPECHHKRMGLE